MPIPHVQYMVTVQVDPQIAAKAGGNRALGHEWVGYVIEDTLIQELNLDQRITGTDVRAQALQATKDDLSAGRWAYRIDMPAVTRHGKTEQSVSTMRNLLEMVEARALTEAPLYSLDWGKGLTKVQSTIALHPKRVYFIDGPRGTSLVITTQVTDKMVTYVQPPSRREMRLETPIFGKIAQQGTEAYLARHKDLEARLGIKTQGAHLRASLTDLLAGGKGLPADPRDYEKVTAYVVPVPGADFSGERNGDAWYAAEGYGNVGGTDVDGQQGYEISYMDRATLLDLKKDKRFKVVRVVDEKHE